MLQFRGKPFAIACITLAIQAVPVIAVLCPIVPTSFFNQTFDHDSTSSSPSAGNGTFLQQYQLNTTFFRRGGPILFYQGAESVSITCVEDVTIWDWAENLGAIVAGLEHRSFGESLPSEFNYTTATPSDWLPLTLNNALLDSVNFVDRIKKSVPGAENSKVIVSGGEFLRSAIKECLTHYERFRLLWRYSVRSITSLSSGNFLRRLIIRSTSQVLRT